MPHQVPINGVNGVNGVHKPEAAQPNTHRPHPGLDLDGFRWTSVDEKFNRLSGHHEAASVLAEFPSAVALVAPSIAQLPPLGPLAAFKGTFTGNGFNTIFRPANSSTGSTTHFPNPVQGPPFPAVPNDNVLELNLTQETLSFTAPLGDVPNRGSGQQSDIHLNGVAYIQAVNDVTNTATGLPDPSLASNIHVEPGTWMHVPASSDPTDPATLVRMASIPHGTTINAQCISPTTVITGKPDFTTHNIISIQPFPTGTQQGAENPVPPFPSQTAANKNTARLPQDLSKFIETGTITDEIIENPNLILGAAIKNQNITSFQVFTVSTQPQTTNPISGGGTANISFLSGDSKGDGPNADAAQMSATFWIETVEHQLVIPPFPPGRQEPMALQPQVTNPKVPVPTFLVHPPSAHITAPRTITVSSTQIQYSQFVLLNFNGLSWPHISVATLVPSSPIPLSIPGVPT